MAKSQNRKLKVIVDANTLMRAVIHPRFAFEVLNHAFKQDYELILIPFTIEEAVRNVSKKFPDRLSILEQFLLTCPFALINDPSLKEIEKYKNIIRDTTDLPLAVGAIQAKVDYLVTNDKDFVGKGSTTKNIQKKLNCLTAGNFLKNIFNWTSKELEAISNRNWQDLA